MHRGGTVKHILHTDLSQADDGSWLINKKSYIMYTRNEAFYRTVGGQHVLLEAFMIKRRVKTAATLRTMEHLVNLASSTQLAFITMVNITISCVVKKFT